MSDNVNLERGSMPTYLERHWPKLALLLTLVLFAGLLFAPALAQGFATPFIVLTLGMGILLLALRHWRSYRAGKLSRLALTRNILVETASLLLTFTLALLSALAVGAGAGLVVQKTWGKLVR